MENENVKKEEVSKKDWLTSLLLCWFLGFLGVHRFYTGKLASGFLMFDATILATICCVFDKYLGAVAFIIVGAFVVNDFINISIKNFSDCRGHIVSEDTAIK